MFPKYHFFHLIEQVVGVRNSASFELGVGVGYLDCCMMFAIFYILSTLLQKTLRNNPPVVASVVSKGIDLSYYIMGL